MSDFYAQLDDSGKVVGQFGSPQAEDTPRYAALATDDPRVAAYLAVLTQGEYMGAVQRVLDAKAQERFYDNIATAASYAGDPDATFNAEGTALRAWRSAVWRYCYQQLDMVKQGEILQPTIDEFVASLPAFSWPNS